MESFISWVGGKKLLRQEIIKHFPADGIEKYVEPFGGAGWVLFGKNSHKKEIYNDINGELVNLFRMVKHHPNALQEELELMLNSREEFFRQKNTNPDALTELQRAARMFYLIRTSFGAKVDTFGVNFRDVSVIKNLQEVHKRLAKVLIENKSFEEIIQKHDGEETLFYLDPPYHGTEKMYHIKSGFGEKEHVHLANLLKSTKGKWILSYNDDPFIRELYQGFQIEEIKRSNNMSFRDGKKSVFHELIIKNY